RPARSARSAGPLPHARAERLRSRSVDTPVGRGGPVGSIVASRSGRGRAHLSSYGSGEAIARRVEGEPEGAPLAVAADAPMLSRVDDLSAELADPAQRLL